jgi:hypothetical protein
MNKNLIIPKRLLLCCKEAKVLDQFVTDYYHFFHSMERVSDFMLIITSSIDLEEARELTAGHNVIILQSDDEYVPPTIDEILDKIGKSNFGVQSLNWNEKIILYEYQASLEAKKK